jgi:hypothetical protein
VRIRRGWVRANYMRVSNCCLPYLIVKLRVHILGDFVLDVPGLGAGVEVTAGQAHGLGQQPAEQLLLPVLTMSLLPGPDKDT